MKIYLTRRQCELLIQQLSYNGLDTEGKLELLKIEVRIKDVCSKQAAHDKTTYNGILSLENLLSNDRVFNKEVKK